ncbi:MAG: helix-turn-helix domain-containing protein [Microthrixaceae bacterium]
MAGARVDDIAAHAEVNKRMLYYYFGSKEELFHEILRRKLEQRVAEGFERVDLPRRTGCTASGRPHGRPRPRPAPHVGGARAPRGSPRGRGSSA